MRQAKTFTDCPHKDAIQHCPLYVAGHVPNLLTCFTGAVETDYGIHCAVERGEMDYRHAAETVRAINPILVAQCEFGQMKSEAMAQHKRNMRANGVH